jgi:hypothetical protein
MPNILSELFQKQNVGQVVLAVLFLIFLISGYPIPYSLATVIDNIYGKAFVVLIAVVLFIYANPIVGVLGLLVAFQLIIQSSIEKGTFAFNELERQKTQDFSAMNRDIKRQQTRSLEHEIIRKMAPTSNDFGITVESDANVKAIMDNDYDASPITSSN